jgi:Flp pilus assembly protein TadG
MSQATNLDERNHFGARYVVNRLDKRAVALGKTWLRRSLGRLVVMAGAEQGTSAVEFALAVPILVGLLVPVADLGLAFAQQTQVQQAAAAGAQYAANNPWNSNSPTAIANAVTAASTLPAVTAAPAPSQTCGCPSNSTVTIATCNTTCSNGQPAGYYVVVNAQSPYTPQLPYSLLGSSVTLTAQSTVRVR